MCVTSDVIVIVCTLKDNSYEPFFGVQTSQNLQKMVLITSFPGRSRLGGSLAISSAESPVDMLCS